MCVVGCRRLVVVAEDIVDRTFRVHRPIGRKMIAALFKIRTLYVSHLLKHLVQARNEPAGALHSTPKQEAVQGFVLKAP